MSRYIDKEELKAELKKKIELSHKAKRAVIAEDFEDIINDMPTEDVVEVKHGKWVDYSDDFYRGMDLRCSICNTRASAFVGSTEDWWDNWKPSYCPHCGAKMDGKGGEG